MHAVYLDSIDGAFVAIISDNGILFAPVAPFSDGNSYFCGQTTSDFDISFDRVENTFVDEKFYFSGFYVISAMPSSFVKSIEITENSPGEY